MPIQAESLSPLVRTAKTLATALLLQKQLSGRFPSVDGSGSGLCRQVREAVLGDWGMKDANP